MAAMQGISCNMSSSTGSVSRLTELQTILEKLKILKIPSTNTKANTQQNSEQHNPNNRTQENHLQARFQQKQLQEKEQKLLALYEEQAHQGYQRFGPGGGKVRQLFQERRGHNHHHSAGWDKSYPLEPINDSKRERGSSLDRNLNNVWKQPVRRTRSQVRRDDELSSSRSYEPLDQLALKHNPVFGDENDYLSRVTDLDSSRLFRKLPNIGGAPLSDSTDRFKTYIATKQHPNASMAPAKETRITEVGSITKALSRLSPPSKKTEVKASTQPGVNSRTKPSITPPSSGLKPRNNTVANNNNRDPPRPASDPPSRANQEKEPPKMNRGPPTTRGAVPRAGTTAGASQIRAPQAARGPQGMKAPVGPTSGARSDLVPCKTCNRSFAPDRIQAHAEICVKTARKKRKPFDVAKQRVKGTELEQFARKGRTSTQPPPSLAKSNWRRKHEEFISNIRAAKQAQQHVARGGKLADLPPPPPLDTSDYVQCPHCGRRFNQGAAERHIPKCANMLHNKPKPAAGGRATGGGAKPRTTGPPRR